MSQLEVDKIIPQSGTTLTIGDSGDTITFGTGTTPQLGGNLDLNSNDITGTGNINITGNITASGNLAGTLTTASQPNITSVGTLTSLDVTGTVTAGAATLSGTAPVLTYSDTDNSITAVIGSGTSDFNIATTSSHSIDVRTNNTRRMVVESDGDISFYEDTGTTPKLFWDASAERLGIGTTSPTATLDINGVANFGDGNTRLNIEFSGGNARINNKDNSSLLLSTSDTERMRIDSSGNVGIGTSSPAAKLNVNSGGANTNTIFDSTDATVLNLYRDDTGSAQIASTGGIFAFATGGDTSFAGLSEAMRIDSSGNVLFGTTDVTPYNNTTGGGAAFNNTQSLFTIAREGGNNTHAININKTSYVSGTADILGVNINGSLQGEITTTDGTTILYNGFTGTHWSRLSDNSKPTILKGTILESLDEMMDWYQVEFQIETTDNEGNIQTVTKRQEYNLQDGQSLGDVITYNYNTENEDEEGNDIIQEVQATIIEDEDTKHTKCKISDTVEAKNVYGVFTGWDDNIDGVNDLYIAQTGSYVVRLNSSVTTLNKGDLIQSNGDGTGKVQADDLLRASTVAKVLSTTKIETYEDGSYIVPCSLHC